METKRETNLHFHVNDLIDNFDRYLEVYISKTPFQKYGQFEYHENTIRYRIRCGSAIAALDDYSFVNYLYKTLKAWGIGVRGSVLLAFPEFKQELQNKKIQISHLDGLRIDNPNVNIMALSDALWQLIDSLQIVQNNAKLVACTKTLHHVLPDLVVPIDREYTRKFFGWHGNEFQYYQQKFLSLAVENFSKIGRQAKPEQYVGSGWNTSLSKVIDNAIVGFMIEHPRDDL